MLCDASLVSELVNFLACDVLSVYSEPMADPIPPVNPEPTPTQLSIARLPDPITSGERETYEAKIAELKERIETLEAENLELKTPPKPKKKSILERFAP